MGLLTSLISAKDEVLCLILATYVHVTFYTEIVSYKIYSLEGQVEILGGKLKLLLGCPPDKLQYVSYF